MASRDNIYAQIVLSYRRTFPKIATVTSDPIGLSIQ